ncbi:hypothetical protein CANARDRAFT_30272 [[Candida] arabinofermentans NRRL YB-2248]|uniref:Restriction of telomere capping protein 1 n=1 Tax=[Candida] arabinofermentans NRRL YB-2248 TaxID=983967 RepID=A0A1E4SUL6_9ASCO|nr:hypothetical protein CANARDRAFT_30272 [[Candida] arabinofermentans NRRL YB-2248]
MSEESGRRGLHSSYSTHSYSIPNNSSPNIPMSSNSLSSSPSSPVYLMDQSRRSSGNFSRMAFNMYGIQSGTSPNTTMNSSNHNLPATSLSILPSTASFSHYYPDRNTTKFQSNNEILTCAKSNETPNLFVIGGPKSLQLLKISNNEVSLEYDLATQPNNTRNTKFGLMSDAKFGHQQYGRNLAISTLSGSIHLYNLDRGNRIRTSLSDHQRAVNSIDFNHINPYNLISGSQDGKMKLWDLRMKNTKAQLTINGNADAVRCVQFNPRDPKTVCSIFDSGVIQKWDIRKPNSFERRLNAHTGPGLTLDWHPELDYIISGGRDKQIQVWSMSSNADSSREPDHVINTSGAVSKVSWCRGRGNGSIMNTDIAAVFLNDDPCIQIWNLNRKFIAKNVIECHSNQVTGLLWRTPKYLVSCSKDKTLFQHDVTLEPRTLDNLSPITMAWDNKSFQNLMMIKQDKYQFETHNENMPITLAMNATLPNNSQPPPNATPGLPNGGSSPDLQYNNTISTQQQRDSEKSGTPILKAMGSPAIGSSDFFQQQQAFSPSPVFNSPLPSTLSLPQSSMNSGESSKLTRANSTFSRPMMHRQISNQKQTQSGNAFAVPVEIPLAENESEVFEFLSSLYMISIPDGLDIIQVCEYNATIAGSAKRFRDCQTWRTIKASILWEKSEKYHDLIDGNFHNYDLHSASDDHTKEKSGRNMSIGTYGTNDVSQSEKLGTSPGSFMESIHSHSLKSTMASEIEEFNEFKSSQLKEKLALENKNDEATTSNKLETPYVTATRKTSTNTDRSLVSDLAVTDDNEDAIIDDEDEPTVNESADKSPISRPIEIKRTVKSKRSNSTSSVTNRYTFSYTGSSADFDNEKQPSSSPSLARSPRPRSFTNNSGPLLHSHTSMTFTKAAPDSPSNSSVSTTKTRKQSSGAHSRLTSAILHDLDSKADTSRSVTEPSPLDPAPETAAATTTSTATIRPSLGVRVSSTEKSTKAIKLKAPWNPTEMIKQAATYSAKQGDLTMCATLTLLFLHLYPGSITERQAKEWILTYHEVLMSRTLFATAAAVLRCASAIADRYEAADKQRLALGTGDNDNDSDDDDDRDLLDTSGSDDARKRREKLKETYDIFATMGQTRTSVRLFCIHCDSLILNDGSKAKINKQGNDDDHDRLRGGSKGDPNMEQLGFWYCEKCLKVQGYCMYCNEPIKGTCVTLSECGHKGHFGCMKSWFIDLLEKECPSCGILVIT